MAIDLLAIVGQTASGKSSLALEIASKLPAEIVAADSKTIYKGLDIGTAKPTQTDRQLVRHHLLDIAEPQQAFSVAQFQAHAKKAIKEIHQRRCLPILVGGSGLYVDSILRDYDFSDQNGAQPDLRDDLEKLSILQLRAEIERRKLVMPENSSNRRYLIRSLERGSVIKKSLNWRQNSLVIGLRYAKDVLEGRIRRRLQAMLEAGLLEEAKEVIEKYPVGCEPLKSNIYAALRPYFAQKISLDQALEDFVRRDLALAKKQMTWFKRHPQIKWFDDCRLARDYILEKLA